MKTVNIEGAKLFSWLSNPATAFIFKSMLEVKLLLKIPFHDFISLQVTGQRRRASNLKTGYMRPVIQYYWWKGHISHFIPVISASAIDPLGCWVHAAPTSHTTGFTRWLNSHILAQHAHMKGRERRRVTGFSATTIKWRYAAWCMQLCDVCHTIGF